MIRHMLLGIPPTVHAASNEAKAAEKKCENCPGVCKPSELPIYPKDSCKCRNPIVSDVSFVYKAIEAPVATVRVQVQEAVNKFLDVNSQIKDSYDNTINNTRWLMRYLREEDHEQQRLGAVAVGTLSGFIFGLRGGIFKRLWYASIGTGIMGAICFPEQSEVVARETFNNGKYLAKISYNFLYGVKPGDPQPEFNFPELKLPQNFSEFVDLSTSVAKSIKNSVSPPPSSNEDKKPSEDKKSQ